VGGAVLRLNSIDQNVIYFPSVKAN
jgi:hypothetical protein